MNSIITAKYISEKNSFAGQGWYYSFRQLPLVFQEDKCATAASSLANRYAELTGSWEKERNSEWICRIYLSAKMILAASLQLASRQYAQSKNLRSVDPYLAYYAMLSSMRAIVFTLPEQEWNDGKIITLSHAKILNLATDHIKLFDQRVAAEVKRVVLKLRAERELISYWHPSSGDKNLEKEVDVEAIATLLCEVAQFNSEMLDRSILKRGSEEAFEFLQPYIKSLESTQLHGFEFFDQEDAYRLNYLRRKYPSPPNILHVMTEGHVEDFFGAWVSDDETKDGFDPDTNWQIIFNVP